MLLLREDTKIKTLTGFTGQQIFNKILKLPTPFDALNLEKSIL